MIKSSLPREETVDPVRMVKEFTTAVEKEVDFTNELRNLQRFQRGFAGDATIHVPRTFDAYCAEGVLTMEFIEGVKPSSREAVIGAGLDPALVAERGAVFVLRQIFDLGFFHTDPHPGNFFVQPGNVLAALDFGQVAHLTQADRQLLADLVLAIVDQDASRLVGTFERSDMIEPGVDLHQLVADMEDMLQQYHGLPLRDIPFNTLMLQTFDLMRKHRIRPPAQFTLMLKSLMTIESLARALNPDFQIIEHLQPYARRLAWDRADPRKLARQARRAMLESLDLAARLPENLSALMRRVRSGQVQVNIRHEHLESLVFTLYLSANRISFALIIAGLLVGSSILVTQGGKVFGLVQTQTLGLAGYVTAAVLGLWLVISILRGRHLEE
jgi:ubiquinone biosynthesis protein